MTCPSTDFYVSIGALEIKDGLYYMTDQCQQVAPELYEAIIDDVDETILSLIDKGLMTIEYHPDLSYTLEVTELGRQVVENDNN